MLLAGLLAALTLNQGGNGWVDGEESLSQVHNGLFMIAFFFFFDSNVPPKVEVLGL